MHVGHRRPLELAGLEVHDGVGGSRLGDHLARPQPRVVRHADDLGHRRDELESEAGDDLGVVSARDHGVVVESPALVGVVSGVLVAEDDEHLADHVEVGLAGVDEAGRGGVAPDAVLAVALAPDPALVGKERGVLEHLEGHVVQRQLPHEAVPVQHAVDVDDGLVRLGLLIPERWRADGVERLGVARGDGVAREALGVVLLVHDREDVLVGEEDRRVLAPNLEVLERRDGGAHVLALVVVLAGDGVAVGRPHEDARHVLGGNVAGEGMELVEVPAEHLRVRACHREMRVEAPQRVDLRFKVLERARKVRVSERGDGAGTVRVHVVIEMGAHEDTRHSQVVNGPLGPKFAESSS